MAPKAGKNIFNKWDLGIATCSLNENLVKDKTGETKWYRCEQDSSVLGAGLILFITWLSLGLKPEHEGSTFPVKCLFIVKP